MFRNSSNPISTQNNRSNLKRTRKKIACNMDRPHANYLFPTIDRRTVRQSLWRRIRIKITPAKHPNSETEWCRGVCVRMDPETRTSSSLTTTSVTTTSASAWRRTPSATPPCPDGDDEDGDVCGIGGHD